MLGTFRGTEKDLFLTPKENVVITQFKLAITQLNQFTAKEKYKS